MKRLFVAIDLPAAVKLQLQRLLPQREAGLRPVLPEQLHITLHFLGDAEPQPIAEALAAIHTEPFQLSLQGGGHFRTHGNSVYWLGVCATPRLRQLHAAIGEALTACGYQPERRRFTPHVTLLRAKRSVPKRKLQEFLRQLQLQSAIDFKVSEFCLFSSQLTEQGPRYTIERRFPSL